MNCSGSSEKALRKPSCARYVGKLQQPVQSPRTLFSSRKTRTMKASGEVGVTLPSSITAIRHIRGRKTALLSVHDQHPDDGGSRDHLVEHIDHEDARGDRKDAALLIRLLPLPRRHLIANAANLHLRLIAQAPFLLFGRVEDEDETLRALM